MSGSRSRRNHRREARRRAEGPKEFHSRASPKRVGRVFALLTRTYHGSRVRTPRWFVPVQKTAILTSRHDRLRDAGKDLFADRGYESTSTAEICRLAGTSQSQLIKHFNSKLGLLEAVFEHAWEQINPAIRVAAERI